MLLLIVLGAAYYFGGYVSGRMARFDGARQGLAVWGIGLAVTVVLAVAGALFGAEYNVLERLNLPRIPIDEGSLTLGAAIALVAVVVLHAAGRGRRRQGRRALPPQGRPLRLAEPLRHALHKLAVERHVRRAVGAQQPDPGASASRSVAVGVAMCCS